MWFTLLKLIAQEISIRLERREKEHAKSRQIEKFDYGTMRNKEPFHKLENVVTLWYVT